MKQATQMVNMQRTCVGSCEHTVTSRKIGTGWNIRVFLNGILNQEMRVYARNLIGAAARDMLRWEDKCGNISQFSSHSRHRG